MTTIRTFSTADADRLLGLADQFLQDWAETAHRHGEPDDHCRDRASEWEAIRPLLQSAPALLDLLNEVEISWGDAFDTGDSIDGGDLVEWFAQWLSKVRSLIATVGAQSEAAD
jgi:hypothetical protein